MFPVNADGSSVFAEVEENKTKLYTIRSIDIAFAGVCTCCNLVENDPTFIKTCPSLRAGRGDREFP
jgi:hypothetical protein